MSKNAHSTWDAILSSKPRETRKVHTILSDDWPYNTVGLQLSIPISGKEDLRAFLLTCAHLAFNRNTARLIRSNMHGLRFNPIANRIGLRGLYIENAFDEKGLPASVTLRAWCKPHQVGKSLALMCAMLAHSPSVSDGGYAYFSGLSRQKDHLDWGCTTIYEALQKSSTLCVFAAKAAHIRSDAWTEQFEKVFKAKSKPPEKKGKVPTIDAKALEEYRIRCQNKEMITFNLSKAKSDFTVVFLAQIIGRKVYHKGDKLSFNVREIEKTMIIRRIRNICRSEGAIQRMANVFEKFGPGRDSTPEKEQHISMMMLAHVMGVPSPSAGSMNVKAIHKDLEHVFE